MKNSSLKIEKGRNFSPFIANTAKKIVRQNNYLLVMNLPSLVSWLWTSPGLEA